MSMQRSFDIADYVTRVKAGLEEMRRSQQPGQAARGGQNRRHTCRQGGDPRSATRRLHGAANCPGYSQCRLPRPTKNDYRAGGLRN